MDQGIIESLKRRYRLKFVGVLLEKMEKTESGNVLVNYLRNLMYSRLQVNSYSHIVFCCGQHGEVPNKL
jgi:hypothetical protein